MINFNSKTERQLLLYFYLNPDKTHHLRELASILQIDPGNLSRTIKTFTTTGLINWKEVGRLKFFSLNTSHPLYHDIKNITLKTQGIPTLLTAALNKLDQIDIAFIYGSFAQNEMDAQSDIDLMVIGNVSSLEIAKIISPVEKQTGREIHFRIFSLKEYKNRIKKKDPFIKEVLNNKVIKLISDD